MLRVLDRIHRFALIAFAAFLGSFEGAAQITCVAVLVTALLTGRFRGWRPGWIELGLAVWALAGVPGAISAAGRAPPIASQDLLRPLLALAFLAASRGLIGASDRTFARMAWAFGIACTVNAAYGFLQHAFGELPLDGLLLKNKVSPQIFVPGQFGVRGVSGLFYNRLKLAHVGITALGLMALVPFVHKPPLSRRAIVATALGAAVLSSALFLTYARMALAAFFAGCLATAAILSRPRIALTLLLPVVVFAAFVFGTEAGHERLVRELGDDIEIRRTIYGVAVELWGTAPLLGIGHGVYRSRATPLAEPHWSDTWIVDAHQLFLHVLAETGLVGLAGFLLAIAGCLALVIRRVRANRTAGDAQAVLDRVALCTVLMLLALGMVHYPLHHVPVALLFWFALGAARLVPAQL